MLVFWLRARVLRRGCRCRRPTSPAAVSVVVARARRCGWRRRSRPCRRGAPAPPCRSRPPPCARRRCRRAASPARRHGTAWRCMFEPISARLASSCSRNGISEAATDTICDGATSMYWILSGVDSMNSFLLRQDDQLVGELAVLVDLRVRLRDHVLAFLDRRQVVDLVGRPCRRRPCGTASRGSRIRWCARTARAS